MEHFSTNQRKGKYQRQPVRTRSINRQPEAQENVWPRVDLFWFWIWLVEKVVRVFQTKYDEAKPKQCGITLDAEFKIALTPWDTYFSLQYYQHTSSLRFLLNISCQQQHRLEKREQTKKNKNSVFYLCTNLWNCSCAWLICVFYIVDSEKHRRMHRFFFSVSANCKCQGTTWFVLIPLIVKRRKWFGFVSLFLAIRFSLLYRHPGHVVSSCVLDPLTPKSDQHLISPHNITTESLIKVMRIKGNDHQLKKLLIVNQILLVSIIGNV